MTESQDNFTIEVPRPLSKYLGQAIIDQDNQDLLLQKRKKTVRFQKKTEVKEAQQHLDELNVILDNAKVETLLDEYDNLKQEIEAYKIDLFNLKQEHARSNNREERAALTKQAKLVKENIQGVRDDRKTLNQRLKPYRKIIAQRDHIEARLQEHFAAILREKQEKQDTLDMDAEARMIAERIILRLASLSFRHKTSKRDMFGKSIIKEDLVRFERIICTPDKVWLKVDVSRLGLLGGHIDNLPHDVYAQDIVKEKVLAELSIALERPVKSPNTDGDARWHNGVWYEVDRLGLTDGLQTKVYWSEVMKRYPENKRELIPVPMGVKKGRKINWVELANQPHIMVNGVTGFGKSNLIQMFLATLVSKHSPDEARYIIVDIKDTGDFRWFENLPHCLGKANEVGQALSLIERCYKEMKRRSGIIKKITNNIESYNRLVKSDDDKIPHIFFIFDEYPSIRIAPKLANEIDTYASMIAMQGRASGVHMFVSGQQSYASAIPRLLAANTTIKMTARQSTMSGALATTGTSETMKMENIKGRFLCVEDADNYQVQMPFISQEDGDLDKAVREAYKWGKPRHFELPAAEHVPENVETMPKLTDEEIVLRAAFNLFEGKLKLRAIWEANKNDISQVRTKKAIDRLLNLDYIVYEEKHYQATKVRNTYELYEVAIDEQNKESA